MLDQHIECPSGLQVTVREFLVKDEDLLADQSSVRKGIALTKLLDAITTKLVDPGPYTFDGDKVDWDRVLIGDRLVVFLFNRLATWGPLMDVSVRCPDDRCASLVNVTVDLDKLEIKKLPDEGYRHLKTGEPINVKIPSDGTEVGFRLLVGKDERFVQKIQQKAKTSLSSSLLKYRLCDLSAIDVVEQVRWVENLSSRDSAFLRAKFDEYDCGIEHSYEFECPRCGHEWKDDVQFGADFLFPAYKKRDATTG